MLMGVLFFKIMPALLQITDSQNSHEANINKAKMAERKEKVQP